MITIDFETRSYANIKKVGAWNYAKHPTTEIICCAYGIDTTPIQTWWPGKKLEGEQAWPSKEWRKLVARFPLYDTLHRFDMPYDLWAAVQDGVLVEAHNVAFEKSIWRHICAKQYSWPRVRPRQWRDTQAVAAYYAMPRALDKLGEALGIGRKHNQGARLITKYCKLYLKTAKHEIPHEDFYLFVDYCVRDVQLEQAISNYLGDLPPEELEVFLLDQEINFHGLLLDEESIHNASAIVEKRAAELAQDFYKLTALAPTQRDKVLDWLKAQGYDLENLQADYIERILEGEEEFEVDGLARRVLELRTRYNKASTKKLKAMLDNRDADDSRARYQVQYHGASTGRSTGTGFQPLNMSRGREDLTPEELILAMEYRDPRWLDVMYGDATDIVGKASRHHIQAPPGHRLMSGDYSSIEAVVLSCLAGEEWKVEAFHNRDPLYELMGCKIHSLPEEAEQLARRNKKAFKERYPDERQDGKVGELSFGYQGALGAWRKFDKSKRHTDSAVRSICRTWRDEHPATCDLWFDMGRAAIRATETKRLVEVNEHIAFEITDDWLAMWLPNNKRIWYCNPHIRIGMPHYHKPLENEDCADGTCSCQPEKQLWYKSSKGGRWLNTVTYGGKLTENVTQATAREILVPAMLKLRKAGYKIILSVYDEIVCEMPNGKGSLEEMKEIMASDPGDWGDLLPKGSNYMRSWARDWPVSVDAWEGSRYKK